MMLYPYLCNSQQIQTKQVLTYVQVYLSLEMSKRVCHDDIFKEPYQILYFSGQIDLTKNKNHFKEIGEINLVSAYLFHLYLLLLFYQQYLHIFINVVLQNVVAHDSSIRVQTKINSMYLVGSKYSYKRGVMHVRQYVK